MADDGEAKRLATCVRDRTLSRIDAYRQGRGDWNVWRSLKEITEQAVHDYEHRAVVELVQNAHDAHDGTERAGRVLVRLDHEEGDHGVLYVANTGRPFSDSNVRAITDVSRSDKRPEEGIGNKGIGFKSVLQLTRDPEVYSTSPTDVGRPGYAFRFAQPADLAELAREVAGAEAAAELAADVERDVFHLCLPVPLATRPGAVDVLLAGGYVSVVRLPLKSAEARGEAVAQLASLVAGPPALLFLRRITELTVEDVTAAETTATTLDRVETPVATSDGVRVSAVRLGADEFVLAERTVPADVFAAAIARSVDGGHIGNAWRDWDAQVDVAVALPAGPTLGAPRLYTHLPMGADAVSPLPAYVNAPFFARLARLTLEASVPLNDALLDEVAELCARVLVGAAAGRVPLMPEAAVDLLSWCAADAPRLAAGFARLDADVATAPVVPLAGGGHGSLAEVFTWEDAGCTVLTTDELVRSAGISAVVHGLSKARRDQFCEAASRLAGRRPVADSDDIAAWAESVAAELARRPFDGETWAAFYDDLRAVVPDRGALAGRRILVDDNGNVRACNTKGGGQARAVAFFAPGVDDGGGPDTDLQPPAGVDDRVFFVAQQIPWTDRQGTVTRRAGRRMLDDGLVHEYRASTLLPAIASGLDGRRSRVAREVLSWVVRFAMSREEPPWRDLAAMNLLVPVTGGRWIRANEALLSKGWGGPEAGLLDELVSAANGMSPEIAALSTRLLVPPDAPELRGFDTARLRDFLLKVGVRTGLVPEAVPRSTVRAARYRWGNGTVPVPATLSEHAAQVWCAALRENSVGDQRLYTDYETRTPLYRLPGQDDYDELPATARRAYGELVAHGLDSWPDETLTIYAVRHNAAADRLPLPTPAAAFVRRAAWVPVARPGARTSAEYVRARDAWSTNDESAPPFADIVVPSVRRALNAGRAVVRAREFGVRWWEDPSTAGARVRALAEAFENGAVAETVVMQFRAAYEDAWATAIRSSGVGTPLDAVPRAPVVVAFGARLAVVDLRDGDTPVYVQDGPSDQRLSLVEQSGVAVFRVRDTRAPVAARLAASFGALVRPVSQVPCSVTVNDTEFVASDAAPLLIDTDTEWLVDLVAAVVESRRTGLARTHLDAARRVVADLRRVRVAEGSKVDVTIDGLPVTRSGARALPVPDERYPTVVVQVDDESDRTRVLKRVMGAVADLLGHAEYGDALRAALAELVERGYGVGRPPNVEALAAALDELPARVAEIARAVRAPDDVALDVLVPLIAVYDLDEARAVVAGEVPRTPMDIAAWLAARASATVSADDLHAAAVASRLDDARLLLGVALRDLNVAIAALGAPYRALRDPDGIMQQFRNYVSVHRDELLDALRLAFLPAYRAGADLGTYVTLRDLATVQPSDAWAEDYLVVPEPVLRAQVEAWLAAFGAGPLGASSALGTLTALWRENRAVVLETAERAAHVVAAWEALESRPASRLPGDPATLADDAVAAGVLDFEPVGEADVVAWLDRIGLWPAGMPATLDAGTLGISEERVAEVARQDERARRHAAEERRRVRVDGVEIAADESGYPAILAAVTAGLTDEFLASSGAVTLSAARVSQRRRGNGAPGTTAARRARLSEAQAAAVGLAGEVAALAWLRAARHDGLTDVEAWRSGYRNQLLGDGLGDDTLGYDIVFDDADVRHMYEVKASDGDAGEFLLTASEMERARTVRRRERYHVLFVAHAMDSAARTIHLLPNPLDPRTAGNYRMVGNGVRYRFTLL